MQKPNISIIGLGKLGSPMLAAFSSCGFTVIGLDKNADFVNAINEGKAPVLEPKLTEYIKENRERVSATVDFDEAVLNSEITFIIVPTPSEKTGGFSTEYARDAAKKIGASLKKKNGFHLVVLTSTVLPGSTEKDILPALESSSGKKCGVDFGLCYNPEFIALGSVIHDLLNPDLVLIGESDERSGKILELFYNDIHQGRSLIRRMSIVNAEITKIALNTYVTTKISYANMLAELCENIAGGNVDVVTDALGCDKRIGGKYLKGAIGYAGPCFPRDNRALVYAAGKLGVSLPIAEATDKINQHQSKRLTKKIMNVLPPGGTVGVLGLSYKIDTDVVEESQGVAIAKELLGKEVSLAVYDPAAMKNAKSVLDNAVFADSLKDVIEKSDVVIITVPWPEFKNINPEWLETRPHPLIIIDCWRILDEKLYNGLIKYMPLGINHV